MLTAGSRWTRSSSGGGTSSRCSATPSTASNATPPARSSRCSARPGSASHGSRRSSPARSAARATVLAGRCPPYGEGITFRPLAEIVDAAGDLAVHLEDEPDAALVADRLSAGSAAPPQDVFWAARRLFEAMARRRPLVLVWDDLHWAEPTLLDLVDHLAGLVRDVPVLLVALARPELLDARPHWGGGKLNATSTLLEPLSDDESQALVHDISRDLAAAVGSRIVAAAEGNPLFLEQMVAHARDDPGRRHGGAADDQRAPGRAPRPAAVRRARRAAARGGRRQGVRGGRGGGAGRAGSEAGARRARAQGPDPARGARQRHVPLPARADPGRGLRLAPEADAGRAARTLRGHPRRGRRARRADRVPPRARLPLRRGARRARRRPRRPAPPSGSAQPGAAPRAGGHLGRSRAARARGGAAPRRLAGAPGAPAGAGGRLPRASATSTARGRCSTRRSTAPDERVVWHARSARIGLLLRTEKELRPDELLAEADEAIAAFERLGDERGLALSWSFRAWVPWLQGQAGATAEAARKSIEHARSVGDPLTENRGLRLLLGAALWGPTPVDEGIRLCDEILERPRDYGRVTHATALRASRRLRGDGRQRSVRAGARGA